MLFSSTEVLYIFAKTSTFQLDRQKKTMSIMIDGLICVMVYYWHSMTLILQLHLGTNKRYW